MNFNFIDSQVALTAAKQLLSTGELFEKVFPFMPQAREQKWGEEGTLQPN